MVVTLLDSTGINICTGSMTGLVLTMMGELLTQDRVETATAMVEHRLPPTQQVGGTRRRVIVTVEGRTK